MNRKIQFTPSPAALGGGECAVDLELAPEMATCIVHFHPTIDEFCDFKKIEEAIAEAGFPPQVVALDTRQTTRINSLGARGFFEFLQRLEPKFQIRFDYLSEPMVTLAAVWPDLLGAARNPIDLFEVCFACAKCGEHSSRSFRPSDLKRDRNRVSVPATSCARCKSPMTPDVEEEAYFRVILSRTK